MRTMQHTWERWEMHAKIWCENLKVSRLSRCWWEDDIKIGVSALDSCGLRKRETSDDLLSNFTLHKIRGISWLDEHILSSALSYFTNSVA
jgi:hypothetical protein